MAERKKGIAQGPMEVNTCSMILGTYTYGSTNSFLFGYNTTNEYYTSFQINSCADVSFSWVKTSGSGYFSTYNNGRNGYLYLNTGQCMSLKATGGGTNRTFTFCRTSGGGGWPLRESNPQAKVSKIYPNPAQDRLIVDREGKGPESLTIIDQMGRTVRHLEVEVGKVKIDLSGMSSGVYLLKIGEEVHRFLKE